MKAGFENSSDMLMVRYNCEGVSIDKMIKFYNGNSEVKTKWIWWGNEYTGYKNIQWITC